MTKPGTLAPVAVVGSGAAGLAAAFRLREAGRQVRLLERNRYPGGRMHTVRRDGFMIEEGPSGLTRGHHSILGIIRDAGLDGELVAASSKIGIAERDGLIHYLDAHHIVRDALRTRLVSRRAKLSLVRLSSICCDTDGPSTSRTCPGWPRSTTSQPRATPGAGSATRRSRR